jgi:type I restriction enzyme M protein
MAIDFPNHLKGWSSLYDRLSYRHGHHQVFSDYVDYSLLCFKAAVDEPGRLKKENERQALVKRYGSDYDTLVLMFHEHVKILAAKLHEGAAWYDLLGTAYECIVGKYKSSAMGQFFTPESLCDLIARMTIASEGQDKTISDPACGSGRLLLAAHGVNHKNQYYGDDKDPLCTKMTAVNMALHGMRGQACCVDTLCLDWVFGYNIIPAINFGYIAITEMPDKFASFSYVSATTPNPAHKSLKVAQSSVILDLKAKFDTL